MIIPSTYFTSKNGNKIHRTPKGYVWTNSKGAVLRQASRGEWDYAMSWGTCSQTERLLFSGWANPINGVSSINGVKSIAYIHEDGEREMFASATPTMIAAVEEALGGTHAAIVVEGGFIARSYWLTVYGVDRPECDVTLCNLLPNY